MKKQVVSLVKNLPVNPTETAGASFNMLVSAWADYKKIAETERTKRAAISAFKETKLAQIESQRSILEQYLSGVFKERASTINGFFERLDRGIENGDSELIGLAIGAIVDITKESPLAGAREIIGAMYDPDIKTIEI